METFNGPRASPLHAGTRPFTEILVHADFEFPFKHGVCIRVTGPGKRATRAKGLVPPRKSGVDNIFAVTDNGYETTVGRVHERRREDFASADLFGRQRDSCSLAKLII